MKKILFILFISLIITGCSSSEDSLNLDQILEIGNYVIIDVRTEEEYSSGHVMDAINIPYDEIDERLEIDKEKTILVYCQSGNRSSIAYNILKNLGYEVLDLGAYESISLPKEE